MGGKRKFSGVTKYNTRSRTSYASFFEKMSIEQREQSSTNKMVFSESLKLRFLKLIEHGSLVVLGFSLSLFSMSRMAESISKSLDSSNFFSSNKNLMARFNGRSGRF